MGAKPHSAVPLKVNSTTPSTAPTLTAGGRPFTTFGDVGVETLVFALSPDETLNDDGSLFDISEGRNVVLGLGFGLRSSLRRATISADGLRTSDVFV